MGILDIFKKRKKQEQTPSVAAGIPKKSAEAAKETPKQVKPETTKAAKKEEKKPGSSIVKSKLIINKEDTRSAYRILFRKLVTEKTTRLERNNQIAFEVHKDANKPQVKEAILRVYGVRPKHVHMIFVKGKHMRFGKSSGKRKDWKKAIITLHPNDKITG